MRIQMIDRVPPHNQEAEQSVIGAIFLRTASVNNGSRTSYSRRLLPDGTSKDISNDAYG